MAGRRILHVIPTLDESGAEKQLTLLACELARAGESVAVCALVRGGRYEQDLKNAGVTVTVLRKAFPWDPVCLYRLTRLMRSWKPDLVQTWLFSANCYGRVAAWQAHVSYVIASERCVDSWKSRYQLAIDRYLSKWCQYVVTNTKAVSEFYRTNGIPVDKLRTIPNGVPVANVATRQQAREKLASLGIPCDSLQIGFVGRLWPQKRVQDLLWAGDIMRIAELKFQLVIVGDGPRRGSLERFAKSLDLVDRVHFLGHRTDARELLSSFDVLALPSEFEGMPNVVLEAMQAGVPVLASRIAGMDEIVIDGETGVLVPVREPLEWAKALKKLIEDPALRAKLGESARQRVHDVFSVPKMVQSYRELYDSLMSQTDSA